MATPFRGFYTNTEALVAAALFPTVLEHRDGIYREYLELSVVF